MLKAHIDACEELLLKTSRIPANSGHTLHKGTPREAFIGEFLEKHLSERVAIGRGEIIDASSKPNERRNQIDIVVYKPEYPRLDFGGGIHAFLSESVVATIEVKSLLDKAELRKAMQAAKTIKSLSRNVVTSFSAGYQPPSILSYVVAYEGPASMETVYSWLPEICRSEGIEYPNLPASSEDRRGVAAPSLDAVFVLGKGFAHFGNTPVGFFSDDAVQNDPKAKWVYADAPHGSLLLFFLFLTSAVSGFAGAWLNPMPYLKSFSVDRAGIGGW